MVVEAVAAASCRAVVAACCKRGMYPLRDCDADLLAANDAKKMAATCCIAALLAVKE